MRNPEVTKIGDKTFEVQFDNPLDARDFEDIRIFMYQQIGHRVTDILKKEKKDDTYIYTVVVEGKD